MEDYKEPIIIEKEQTEVKMPEPLPHKRVGPFMLIVTILFLVLEIGTAFLLENVRDEFFVLVALTINASVIGILVPSLIHIKAGRREGESYNLKRLPLNQILPCILLGIGLCFAAQIIANVIYAIYALFSIDLTKMDDPVPLMNTVGRFIIVVSCMAIAPAVCEEMLCRSVILYSMRSLGMFRAALWSGIFFAVLHLNLPMLPLYVALGFAFGLIAYKTRSVLATMIVHFIYNFTILCFQFIPSDLSSEAIGMLTFSSGEFWAFMLLCSVITAVALIPGIILFVRNCKKNDEKDAEVCGVTVQEYIDTYNQYGVEHKPFGKVSITMTYIILGFFLLVLGLYQISECVIK